MYFVQFRVLIKTLQIHTPSFDLQCLMFTKVLSRKQRACQTLINCVGKIILRYQLRGMNVVFK